MPVRKSNLLPAYHRVDSVVHDIRDLNTGHVSFPSLNTTNIPYIVNTDALRASDGVCGGGSLFGAANTVNVLLSDRAASGVDLFVSNKDMDKGKRREAFERRAGELQKYAKAMVSDDYRGDHPDSKYVPDGLVHCGEPLFIGTNGIYRNDAGEYYFDHIACHSWACPVCAPKRDYLRQQEIREVLLKAYEAGHKMLFLTFTIPHWSRDTCLKTRKAIQNSYTKMRRRARLCRVLREFGYVHQIKCWDFTYGDNGWHPHIHAIWFFDTDADLYELNKAICEVVMQQWEAQVLTTVNRKVSRRHGFNCEPIYMTSDDTADHLAKYTAKRVSMFDRDPEDNGDRSANPFDFLVDKDHPMYEKYKRIFCDYYKGQKGVRRVRTSPALREFYGVEQVCFERPVQSQIACGCDHHIKFLSDVQHFQKFRTIGKQFGDRAALDWLNDAAIEDYKNRLEKKDDPDSRYVLGLIDEDSSGFDLVRRDYVIDYLADDKSLMLYADRVHRLAVDEYNRIERMYEGLERSKKQLRGDIKRSLAHRKLLDDLEIYNLMLPDDALPVSGVQLALWRIADDYEFAGVLNDFDYEEEDEYDFWF